MSQPFIGEIRMFAGNFAPQGWSFCDGSLVSISQNATLFDLIGTTYGGDGISTYALPDLRGRIPLHQGSDSFGNGYFEGQNAGAETVILTTPQLPQHTHSLMASAATANTGTPAGAVLAATDEPRYGDQAAGTPLVGGALQSTGLNQAHNNLMPFLCLSFIISMFGIFPSQS